MVNVMLSLMSVINPPLALCNISVRTVVKFCTLAVLALRVCFDSVYVDLHYGEISLPFTTRSVCLCGVCSHVVVLDLSVRLSLYHVLCVCWCVDCDVYIVVFVLGEYAERV